ncbi:hypothetical protein ACO8D0_05490 [Streptomyces pratensis]
MRGCIPASVGRTHAHVSLAGSVRHGWEIEHSAPARLDPLILVHLGGHLSFATDEIVPGYYGPQTPEQAKLRRELAARIDLFGSLKVRALWEAATEASADIQACAIEGDFYRRNGNDMLPAIGVTDPNYLRFEAAADRTEKALIQQLRHEIDVDQHLKD